jgi:amidohydrolase
MIAEIKKKANALNDTLLKIRRHIHQNPELSFQEFKTTQFVSETLKSWGLVFKPLGATGGYVDIQGNYPNKKVIALRADLDALPIQEQNQKDYVSQNNGVMHACGHDVHTTCLLGVALLLHQLRSTFEGTVRCIFQPGEEKLPGGASLMIKDGILKNPDVQEIVGQHVMPLLEAGKLGFRSGMYMASADEIYITVKGKGGHGAHPHQNIDPVVIAAQIITELQTIVSRHAKPATPSVLSIGKVIANGSTNVIPSEVYMEGTFRTYDEEWRNRAHRLIEKIAKNIADNHGATVDVDVRKGYPFLKNNEVLTQKVRNYAVEYLGEENVVDLELWPAGEDFAFYSQEIPATFYRLGTRNEVKGITSMVHTSTFDIDENALEIGVGFMAYSTLRNMQET